MIIKILERLCGKLKDIYRDRYKIYGNPVKNQPKLSDGNKANKHWYINNGTSSFPLHFVKEELCRKGDHEGRQRVKRIVKLLREFKNFLEHSMEAV